MSLIDNHWLLASNACYFPLNSLWTRCAPDMPLWGQVCIPYWSASLSPGYSVMTHSLGALDQMTGVSSSSWLWPCPAPAVTGIGKQRWEICLPDCLSPLSTSAFFCMSLVRLSPGFVGRQVGVISHVHVSLITLGLHSY